MTKLDVNAFWERCQQRYPKILARLHQSEKMDDMTVRLHETYDAVLVERIPDDMRALLEKLKD